jgi:hypothetical protein
MCKNEENYKKMVDVIYQATQNQPVSTDDDEIDVETEDLTEEDI